MCSQSTHEWALGLYSYSTERPDACAFAEFHSMTLQFLDHVGMSPTHIAADGGKHSGKLVKWTSSASKRIVESGFADLSVLSLAVVPPGSNAPAYDRVVSSSLAWNSPNELLLCLTANEAVTAFKGEAFCRTLEYFLKWRGWDYGFGFVDLVERQPDFHVLGLDNGRLSQTESQALGRWYSAASEVRKSRLRDVYPVNVLNATQRARLVRGQAVEEHLLGEGAPRPEIVNGMAIWTLSDTSVESIRRVLGPEGALI